MIHCIHLESYIFCNNWIHHLFIAFIVFVSIIVGFRLGESDEAIQIQVTEKAMFLGRTTYFDLQTVDFS